jgi:hypothetical protein
MQPSNSSKRLIFHPSTLPPRRGFFTRRRAHMRAYSLYRCAYVRACSLHRRTSERTCPSYRCAHMHACTTHRCALMRACLTHRPALWRTLNSFTHAPMHSYFSEQACTYARLPLNRPRMWAHILSKILSNPLYGPPYLPYPKIESLFLCRMIRALT